MLISNNVQGGGVGVGIFVRNSIPFAVSTVHSVFSDRLFESIFVELTKFLVGSVYIRPSVNHPNLSQTEQFSQSMELLSYLLSLLSASNINARILGDLNINILKYSSLNMATEYIDLLFPFGCLQVITRPTRCNPTCATLIDHVISNSICANISSFILTSIILNHFPIIHHFNTKKTSVKLKVCLSVISRKRIPYWSFCGNPTCVVNWSEVTDCDDAQTAYNRFSDIFNNFFDLHLPLQYAKTYRNISKLEPWLTRGLIVSRKYKLRLSNLAAPDLSPLNIAAFKQFRNILNRVVKLAKKTLFWKRTQSKPKQYEKNLLTY